MIPVFKEVRIGDCESVGGFARLYKLKRKFSQEISSEYLLLINLKLYKNKVNHNCAFDMETDELVQIAYKKYKQYVYHEQLNLFQRKKLADFESSIEFKNNLGRLSLLIDLIRVGKTNNDLMNGLIKEINYWLVPKNLKTPDEKKENCKDFPEEDKHFLTNVKSANEYYLEGANFFIDAPIELHLISTIWLMKVGVILESDIDDSCYGNRLNDMLKRPDDRSSHLFKMYNTQYQNWRNNALNTSKHILDDERKDIAILSLDFKHCFYCINAEFQDIKKYLREKIKNSEELKFAIGLTDIIEAVHVRYREVIDPVYCYSHSHIPSNVSPLPVGFVSSGLLCNWHLKEFDSKILGELNPDYYGRYVDDVLIVIGNPIIEENASEGKIRKFMAKYFCENGIFKYNDENKYQLKDKPELFVQGKKLILHFYSVDHSHALLDAFKQEVDNNASAFFFLPDDDLQYYINETAYNLLFDGSKNKWRNVIGIVENVTELSKNLTKIISGLSQSEIKQEVKEKISDQLLKFYKGKNFINFCRTWEKLFTFTILIKQYDEGAIFYLDVEETINKITKFFPENDEKNIDEKDQRNQSILIKQKADLHEYLKLALSLPLGLMGKDQEIYLTKHVDESIARFKKSNQYNDQAKEIRVQSQLFRKSNLIRHNYVAYPLINFTNYEHSLIDWDQFESFFIGEKFHLNSEKIHNSPRFIHFDEYYLFNFLQSIFYGEEIEMNKFDKKYRDEFSINKKIFPVSIRKHEKLTKLLEEEGIEIIEYCIPNKISMVSEKPTGKIKVGVANIKITDENILSSYHPIKKPNLDFERQKELFSILNLAKKEKCDILVLPELSIPYHWLPFMVTYARNHQLALIFGMEYWIVKKNPKTVSNLIVAALPIKSVDDYKTCCVSIREKNHYSPRERKELERSGLEISKNRSFRYDLFKWRGCQFSIYNCYELADIRHRAVFRSELDLLVACVLNKDVNYFSSIVESVVKDLHCYVVQVNCSAFGDSRIVRPTKREKMDILRVSGGENNTILTAELDISDIRHFQSLEYSENDNRFKPTPPGFNKKNVGDRSRCPGERID